MNEVFWTQIGFQIRCQNFQGKLLIDYTLPFHKPLMAWALKIYTVYLKKNAKIFECRRFRFSKFRFIDILVCRCFGFATFRFVDVSVCRCLGCRCFDLLTFWLVIDITNVIMWRCCTLINWLWNLWAKFFCPVGTGPYPIVPICNGSKRHN